MGGSKNIRGLWTGFYRNIDFTGVIYVVNIQKEVVAGKDIRPVDKLYKSNFSATADRKELSILLNEKELEQVVWLLLFNAWVLANS